MGLPTTGFGQRLALMREEHGWTQSELARRLDVHVTWVSKLERFTGSPDDPKGVRNPTHLPVNDLFRLAYVLQVSPWALLVGWDESRTVEIGDETIEAGDLWAWASWSYAPESFDEPGRAIWRRFSPEESSDDEIIERIADVLGRYEERVLDDGSVEIVRVLSPKAQQAIERAREAVTLIDAAITQDFPETEDER